MIESDFLELQKRYIKETERWEKLKVGQHVYIEFPRFFDMEYYEVEIISIDVKNRKIKGLDYSRDKKEITLSFFYTKEELIKNGINLIW